MRNLKNFILSFFLLITNSSALAQSAQANVSNIDSAKAFMVGYSDDLNNAKRDAIIKRYDPRGHYLLGNGKKNFLSHAETTATYLEKWNPPASFVWHDLSFEVAGPEAMVVTGLFDWVPASGEKRTYSYTALLLLQNGEWKIRIEDESRALSPTISKP